MPRPIRVAEALLDINGQPLDIVRGSGSRLVVTAGAASTAAQAIPGTAAQVLEIRATADVWLRFGASGVSDAAADANAILFPAGERLMVIPYSSGVVVSTHFKALRAGGTDAIVEVEEVLVQSA